MTAIRDSGGLPILGDEPITQAYEQNADYWISMIRSNADPYQTLITDRALLSAIG